MGLFLEGGSLRRPFSAEHKRAPKPPITMGFIGDPTVFSDLKRAAEFDARGDPRANDYRFVGIWPGRGQASVVQ